MTKGFGSRRDDAIPLRHDWFACTHVRLEQNEYVPDEEIGAARLSTPGEGDFAGHPEVPSSSSSPSCAP